MSSLSSLTAPAGACALWRRCHGPALPKRRPQTTALSAFRRGGDDHGGALVDESMAVLRRRIHEAKMAEANYEAPPGWAAWERRYYPTYVSDVSGLVGALQLLLMSTRPSLAMAAVALVLCSVPVSAVTVVQQLEQAAALVLESLHKL